MRIDAIEILGIQCLSTADFVRNASQQDGILFSQKDSGYLRDGRDRYCIKQGSAFFVAAHQPLVFESISSENVVWIAIKLNYCDLYNALRNQVIPISSGHAFREYMHKALSGDSDSKQFILQYVETCLFRAANLPTRSHSTAANKVSDIFRQLDHFIDEHLDENFSISELASSVGYSQKALNIILRENRNCTALEYVTDYKINKSKFLLLCTEQSITDIAYGCGFQSLHYYSRYFKKIEGVSPQMYRMVNKNKS